MWKKYLAVGLGVFLTTAIFMYFLNRQYTSEYNKNIAEAKEKINKKDAHAKILQDSIDMNNLEIAQLNTDKLALLDSLQNLKKRYEDINSKYVKIGNVIKSMPVDAQVRYLSDWLSEEDRLPR